MKVNNKNELDLRRKLDLALLNKDRIDENRIFLDEIFSRGKISYIEYKVLLDNFKDLERSCTELIRNCHRGILREKIKIERKRLF